MYGTLRRSDFLPKGEQKEGVVVERGYESLESDDDEGKGLEYAFQSNAFDDIEEDEDAGMIDADFL